jgi:uncharacterized protein (TIGR04255 family)
MFSNEERVSYAKSQIVEVICQLRFPAILSIAAREPAEFQEKIRGSYPLYRRLEEKPMRMVNGKPEALPPEPNYAFVSADNCWKINLTKNFISFSTVAYTSWEDFARRVDEVLVEFIELYRPAFFERIGLRYVNAFSRKALGLEGTPFAELIQPAYLGLMGEEDVPEQAFQRASQEVEMALPGGCRLKLHCGPGLIKRPNEANNDNELRYLLDIDVFMLGNIEMKHSAGALNTVHSNAGRIFRGAITETLHDAMDPR